MPYTPDATDVAQPADTGIKATTAPLEFRTLKILIAALRAGTQAFARSLIQPAVGTNNALLQMVNTGGTAYAGLDSSVGGVAAVPYALVFYHGGAYPQIFCTSGSERMRIDSAGNVGIGTIPSVPLHVKASSGLLRLETTASIAAAGTAYVNFNGSNGDSGYLGFGGSANRFDISNRLAGDIVLFTSNTERMRLDSVGNAGIGTSSPLSRLDVREANRADSANTSNIGVYTTTAQAAGIGGTLSLGGLFTASTYAPFGSVRGGKENSTDSNYAGYLAFQTTPNSGTLTERMRIDSVGNVGIGATANASAILDVQSTTKGFRLPNMTTAQKNAIASPAAGLLVMDTTLGKACLYTGAAWQTVTSV